MFDSFKIKALALASCFFSILMLSFFFNETNFSLLETSILTMLKEVAEDNAPAPPDLAIEEVEFKKISNPDKEDNYYRYKANVEIKNYGGNIVNSEVYLVVGENEKVTKVRNTEKGFSLKKNKSILIRNFEFAFDGTYNGGDVPIRVEIRDKEDLFKGNDLYLVSVSEYPAKIEGIILVDVMDDGTLVMDYDALPFSVNKHNYEILVSNSISYGMSDMRYDELYDEGNVYGYYRIKNRNQYLPSSFKIEEMDSSFASKFVKFEDNPFQSNIPYSVFVKVVEPESGKYAYSNILMFVNDEEINRAQFAKLFIDYAEVEVNNRGINFYTDVIANEWYTPYVQTLFNLGLLETNEYRYYPEDIMTRGDAVRIVMDYFDADLDLPEDGEPNFFDISMDSELFPYAEGLYSSPKGNAFHDYLVPEGPATDNFLRYLIYEYKEDN